MGQTGDKGRLEEEGTVNFSAIRMMMIIIMVMMMVNDDHDDHHHGDDDIGDGRDDDMITFSFL